VVGGANAGSVTPGKYALQMKRDIAEREREIAEYFLRKKEKISEGAVRKKYFLSERAAWGLEGTYFGSKGKRNRSRDSQRTRPINDCPEARCSFGKGTILP